MADYSSELHPDEMCPNCVTPWKCNGPHYTPEQAEAWKAGREAGMREAAGMLEMTNGQILLMAGELKVGELRAVNAVMSSRRRSILSAIEGAK